MPRLSKWQAQHKGCQKAVDDLKADLTAEIDHLKAENERLRLALDKAAGRLGHLSTALSLSNKPNNAKGALEWSEEARGALEE